MLYNAVTILPKGGIPLFTPLFELTGIVIPGKHLGTRLGFPTANIAYEAINHPLPRDGVYIALAQLQGSETPYLSILNQGRHPTVPQGQPTIEAHLLDYTGGPLYGQTLILSYQRYLRPEITFPSLEALKAQLSQDLSQARAWAAQSLQTAQNPAPKEQP